VVLFSNQTTHVTQPRTFSVQVLSALAVAPTTGFTASGPVGGAFNVTSQTYALTNIGTTALNWGVVNTSAWLTVSSPGGTLAGGGKTSLVVSLGTAANALTAGIYPATVLVTNQGGVNVSLNFTLQVGQSLVQNGGFETGGYSPWNLVDNGGPDLVDNGTYITPHSGTYAFAFGQASSLAYLSQNLPTLPGQGYLLSFWLSNPTSGTTEQFMANWNTNATSTNTLYSLLNPGVLAWTNLNFVVTATGTNTTLQFAVRNDPDYFGLDDVSVTPIPLPTFTGINRTTNAVSLTWNALANVAYLVQYKTNLLQTNWLNLSTNTAAAGTLSFTNSTGPDPRRFYRVRRLP
jgi:hypothetical protein